MTWGQEQVLRAARAVFDHLMRNAVTDAACIKAQDLYYEIEKYKVECMRKTR